MALFVPYNIDSQEQNWLIYESGLEREPLLSNCSVSEIVSKMCHIYLKHIFLIEGYGICKYNK